MSDKKPTPKDLWKANLLEFFHNYFIGISNLECSEEDCPLVLIWDEIEEKNSKKGKCAIITIDQQTLLVVDIVNSSLNGLKKLVEVSVQYADGKTALVRTKEEIKTMNLIPEQKEKMEFIDPSEIVYWFNNPTQTPNLLSAESIYLNELWEIKEKIKWDQKASKKKIINWVEQKVDGEDKAYKIDEWENDYIFNIYNPDITNEIKSHEVYSAKDNKEREQLHHDYDKLFSELRRTYGIRHLTHKKEDRQNNPEIELNEAQFIAIERRKKREREKSIKELEEKGFCSGEHVLTYGTSPEQREEKVLEQQELNELSEQNTKETPEEPKEKKEILIEKK